MRLVQFIKNNIQRVGIELKQHGDIIDLHKVAPSITSDMITFLKSGQEGMNLAKKALADNQHILSRDDCQILSPVTNPEKIFLIGLNYRDQIEASGVDVPKNPLVFAKYASNIIGPGGSIIYPKLSKELGWEVEIVAVIGKEGKYIDRADAMSYVAGFTVSNDVTARDLIGLNNGQFLFGKGFDASLPLGPALVTKDAISDHNNLALRSKLNGKLLQSSNTKNMVFDVSCLVSHLSQIMTLKPGDLISTGSPPGNGYFQKPPVFLKAGDVIECEVDEIGSITNTVVDDTSKL